MNENFETNSDFTGEPVPQAPVKPARGRELILAAVLLVACLWTANSVIFGGYGLGLALGLWTIMLATALYILPKSGRGWYSVTCLGAALLLTASLLRSGDAFMKFCLFALSLGAYFLGLSQWAEGARYSAGTAESLVGLRRAVFDLPYPAIAPAFQGLFMRQTPEGPRKRKLGGVILGLLLAVPVLFVVIPLLMSSDAAFEGLVDRAMGFTDGEPVITLIVGAMLFLPVYARPLALAEPQAPKEKLRYGQGIAPVTLNSFLCAVSLVYLVYLFSQLAYFFSAFEGILPQGFTQAEYARRGFFEMAVVCGINLALVAFSTAAVRKTPELPRLTKALCLFVLGFSMVLVICSGSKMAMYIGAYGLTRLRVLTSLFMVCAAVALICAAVRLLRRSFPYMKIIVLTVLLVGCLAGFADVDTQIARYNVDAYLSGRLETVDVQHLAELSDGAIPELARLLDCQDDAVRTQARGCLERIKDWRGTEEAADFRTWNWASAQADRVLRELNN